jgi:hypothetical protein
VQLRQTKALAIPILVLGSRVFVVPVGSQDLAVYRAGAIDVLHGHRVRVFTTVAYVRTDLLLTFESTPRLTVGWWARLTRLQT